MAIRGDTQYQSEVLEDLSDAANYRRWLSDLVRPYLGDDPIEVGAGLGLHARDWLEHTARLTVAEGDEERLARLRAEFAGDPGVRVRHLLLPAAETGEHSSVVALNVLEHITEDVAALRSMAALLRPGGATVLIVPAFQSAMSAFDHRVGHVRRYTLQSLAASLSGAGLHIEQLRYVNPMGLLAWYVLCRGLGRFPSNGAVLRTYDRLVVPLVRRADRHRAPFGQSVFAVARRTAADRTP
ncbi:methyltransferase [Dactylosporangium sp. NBC_01737]|uniref:class I SAM-dependent methyltransferase n=1 Tax=Dactylosporangium sp. NBC_01737 TaxID=2975959 RepID=UPI002E0EA94D|nr:methyltransferase [Dactylosporangium sp. NBC_01737]